MRLNEMKAPNISKIEGLDSVRGGAAIIVILFHLQMSPFYCPEIYIGIFSRAIKNGYLMVDLFFVLSGFVILSAYRDNIVNFKQLMIFQFLRIGRLYPIHLILLLAYLILEILKSLIMNAWGIVFAELPFEKNTFTAFLQHLFLLQAIGTNNELTFNGAAWSISTEFYTYIIFAVVVLSTVYLRVALFFIICSSSIIMLIIGATFGFESLLRCTAGFFMGCLCKELSLRINYSFPSYFIVIALTTILTFLVLKPSRQFDVAIFFLASFTILTIVHSQTGNALSILKSKPLAWLGEISYSLYMSHALILWGFEFIFYKIIKKSLRIVAGKQIILLTLVDGLITFSAFFIFTLLFSYFLYRFIERPFREFSRRAVSFQSST